MIELPVAVDPAQLARIEGVHRGFLYQHLYAVGCLLLAQASEASAVVMEHDEDIEILFNKIHVYIQVKTRSRRLRLSDIKTVLSRFDSLRALHQKGSRSGEARFRIVTNAGLSETLQDEINSNRWPADVKILWPTSAQFLEPGMPPPWPDTDAAARWCADKAKTVPFSRLSGEALTWKLAALVQLAASGTSTFHDHRFTIGDLPVLFEQMVISLQEFPAAPRFYRVQESEPVLDSDVSVRLIVGVSGAGKTTWAAQAALHCTQVVSYYDVAELPDISLASSLAREIAGRFLKDIPDGLSAVLLPGATGLESLRATSAALSLQDIQLTLFLDNIHCVAPEKIRDIIRVTPEIRYVLLAQPWTELPELEAYLRVQAENLGGWSIQTIAAEFADNDCPIDPTTAERLRQLTGGLPLFVQNAAYLTREQYGRNAENFCNDLEAQTHLSSTIQEVMLTRTVGALPPTAQDAIALLSLSDVALSRDEVTALLSDPLGVTTPALFSQIRTLVALGILQQLEDQRLTVHDAFRLIAAQHRARMRSEVVLAAQHTLRSLLETSVYGHDVRRLGLYLRLLSEIGEIEVLVDLAQAEFIYELGLDRVLRSALEDASVSDDLCPRDRFWAVDTLAFWDIQDGNPSNAERQLSRMESLLEKIDDGNRELMALLTKKMVLKSQQGDGASLASLFDEARARCDNDPTLQRILRYNVALALHNYGSFEESEQFAFQLVVEYFEALGLTPHDVFGKNPEEIIPKIGDVSSQVDNLKHLGDSLHLFVKARSARQGVTAKLLLATVHAIKFYDMAGAVTSIVRLGQDFVDYCLGSLGDAQLARSFLEQSLLPAVATYKLTSYLVPLRAQYAVVLAYCNEIDVAVAEMAQLEAFGGALGEDARMELASQRRLIQAIAAGEVTLRPRTPSQSVQRLGTRSNGWSKVGRNKPCPCGSGKKYKRCHGTQIHNTVPGISSAVNASRLDVFRSYYIEG